MSQVHFPLTQLDMQDGGPFRIAGTTKNTGTPDPTPIGPRRVRLHDQLTGRVVREVFSDATTGVYSFDWVRNGLFYITAFDHTGTYGGVIETDVQPEAMP